MDALRGTRVERWRAGAIDDGVESCGRPDERPGGGAPNTGCEAPGAGPRSSDDGRNGPFGPFANVSPCPSVSTAGTAPETTSAPPLLRAVASDAPEPSDRAGSQARPPRRTAHRSRRRRRRGIDPSNRPGVPDVEAIRACARSRIARRGSAPGCHRSRFDAQPPIPRASSITPCRRGPNDACASLIMGGGPPGPAGHLRSRADRHPATARERRRADARPGRAGRLSRASRRPPGGRNRARLDRPRVRRPAGGHRRSDGSRSPFLAPVPIPVPNVGSRAADIGRAAGS